MAGSDKNARHSVTGGNSTQPAQPLSEVESSAVAGQQLSKLKASDVVSPAVRHETRLGILVITILVFAFCFLVYHKMDMHQRALTQASIPSTAEAGQAAQLINAKSQLDSEHPPSVAADPLLNLTDLSDGSPFSSAEMTAATAAVATEFSFDEPPQGSQVDLSATTVPLVDSAERIEGIETPRVLADSGQPRLSIATTAEFSTFDTPSDREPAAIEPVTPPLSLNVTPVPDEGFLSFTETVSEPEPVREQETETETKPEPEIAAFAESVDSESPAGEVGEEEPRLLAMLEPQQDSGFSGGFIADDNSVSIGQAPVAEPVETFPSFDAADAAPQQTSAQPQQKVTEKSTPFGFQGYDAVTQPGGRTGKNSIRTAVGSGSDGKFSLAAFNYQNSTVEAAPDDGSTFDSVVVQNGDSYTTISKRVYGTIRYFSALAVFNQHRIREPKNMRPGMVVLTPPKELLEKRYPQLFVDSQPKIVEPAEFLVLSDGSPAYRVGERETLSEISARFLGRSSRWIEIYRLNQSIVKDPNKLKAGLILALPADAAEVSVVP